MSAEPEYWIPLTQGLRTCVDKEDFERFGGHKWFADKDRYGFYAARHVPDPGAPGRQRKVKLHREILGLGRGDPTQGDHRDRNKLNNRRDNLRVASHGQNMANRAAWSASGFKGVTTCGRGPRPWMASIRVGSVLRYLGVFASAEEAARAFDVAARVVRGEFAVLNFPGEGVA